MLYEYAFMHISLTPELEQQVKRKVDSGLYNNASEVIRESLRLMLEHDLMLQRLKGEIAIGREQLQRGEGVKINSKADFFKLAKENA